MKLVMMTSALQKRYGAKKALEEIKKAGFDGWDYTMLGSDDEFLPELQDSNATAVIKELKRKADELGLPCLQAHGPCPNVPRFSTVERYVEMSKRAIEFASELECPLIVVHPGAFYSAKENYERIYAPLLAVAERLGVRIATENMFKWKDETETQTVPAACGTGKDFADHIDCANGNPYFTACLDLGHAQMQNTEGAVSMIRALGGKRMGALHVHDNDLWDDIHTAPFVGKSDWEEITSALAEVGYDGHFTYETGGFFSRYPTEIFPELLRVLEKTGRYLIRRIEEKK